MLTKQKHYLSVRTPALVILSFFISVTSMACRDASGPAEINLTGSHASLSSMPMISSQAEVPDRMLDDTPWLHMPDEQLWDSLAHYGSTALVGLKAPGSPRGTWKGYRLIDEQDRRQGQLAIARLPGVEIIEVVNDRPLLSVRLRDLDAVTAVRRLPFVDYIEPAYGKIELYSGSSGCEWPAYDRPFTYTPSGDALPPYYQNPYAQITSAWKRATGAGVTIGLADTGLRASQTDLLTHGFASGMSTGRWMGVTHTYGDSWEAGCSHGTRVAGAMVGPMNGRGSVGVAWKANLVSVRMMSDPAISPISSVSEVRLGIAEAAGFLDDGGKRIVTMAFGLNRYSSIEAEIEYWYYQKDRLFIGACGGMQVESDCNFPADRSTVMAVSAVEYPSMGRLWQLRYGPSVELSFWYSQMSMGENIHDLVTLDGNSGSTAVASGIAALVWSRYPHWTRDQVRARLQQSGHTYPYHTSTMGYGITNAMKAVGGMFGGTINSCSAPDCVTYQRLDQCTTETYNAAPMGGDGPFSYYWSDGSTSQSTSRLICPIAYEIARYSISVNITDQSDGHSIGRTMTTEVTHDTYPCPSCPQ